MGDAKFFWNLNTGIKFNKNKYGEEIDVFKNSLDTSVVDSITTSRPRKSLVFFNSEKRGGYHSTNSDGTESQRKKPLIKEDIEAEKKINVGNDVNTQIHEEVSSIRTFSTTRISEIQREEADSERKQMNVKGKEIKERENITTSGTDIPSPVSNWDELSDKFGLRAYLKRNVEKSGWEKPTAIQMQSIPVMLGRRELLGVAPTGSGKTAAFILPILMGLKAPSKKGLRAVVVCPTGELAQQIHREFLQLTAGKAFKIALLAKTKHFLTPNRVLDVLISTPMKLVHLIKNNAISMGRVEFVVFDEADKLFEMNFVEQLDEIVCVCNSPNVLRSLWSATMSDAVEEMARTFLRDPIQIIVGARDAAATLIDQKIVFVGGKSNKLFTLKSILKEGMHPPCLVFVQTKKQAKSLYQDLAYDTTLKVDVVHSGRSSTKRQKTIENFRLGRIWVLITTDLLGRGMDFRNVNQVINYDMPATAASYIHRIGRTGRAGKKGESITLYTAQDIPMLQEIVEIMKRSGVSVPDWMDSLAPHLSFREREKLRKKKAKRKKYTSKKRARKGNVELGEIKKVNKFNDKEEKLQQSSEEDENSIKFALGKRKKINSTTKQKKKKRSKDVKKK